MKSRILPSEFLGWQTLLAPWASCLAITFLSVAVAAPARSQQPAHPAESMTEAARNAREQKSNSTNHPVVFTNDDVAVQNSTPSASPPPPATSSSTPAPPASINRAEAPKPQTAGCDNPNAEKLKADLQAAEEERDQLRRELSDQPTVISNGDVDLTNFKPSSSGLNVGAPPLLQTQPEAPTRVAEVIVEEKISSLKKFLTIACEPPKEAGTQRELDQAEQELHLLQREFALDQDSYYSKPNYAGDTAGKTRLDEEQQRIQDLQSEVQRLKDKLPASNPN
ncbi:MAG TPA: hypothetical protein VGH37_03275 [Candidatus Acidoferrum sp.]|jgi:hypothetical protein